MSNKVHINLRRLEADLAAKAPKWSVFAALATKAGVKLSRDTVDRVKHDGQATLSSLGLIARVLGTEAHDYLFSASHHTRNVTNISGEWFAFYLETWPPLYRPSQTKERLLIRQSGMQVRGTYEFIENEDPAAQRSTIFEMRGRVVGNFVSGFYFVLGRESEQGIGTFQIKLLDEARYGEGFCTYCSETDIVTVSANIWVKQREETSRIYNENVTDLMREGEFFIRPQAR